jgi:5-methylcytosine-specific restriction enzyme subunit McrC
LAEYGKRRFDSADFVREGRVELNSEAQEKANVTFSWVDGGVRIQAGGMIGLVPLSDTVVLEVKPRVPVARLEELIRRSASAPFVELSFNRGFTPVEQDFLSLDDLMAARFSEVLRELSFEGLFKTYARVTKQGTSPAGRILPAPTYLSLRTSLRPRAHFQSFTRTIDNEINRLILAAGTMLLGTLEAKRRGSSKLAIGLRSRLQVFEGVKAMPPDRFWRSEPVPANRPILQQAVELSRLILMRCGVRFFGHGPVTLPSFVINMETVFENYVRRVLEGNPHLATFGILDGNLRPPKGAASNIFEVAGPLGNHETKPDIVIKSDHRVLCVADVKYKPCPKQPDRSNLEQVLVYALSYGAPCAVLMFPCSEGQATAVEFLGKLKDINCYKMTLQLMNPDLDAEEMLFCKHLEQLLEGI